MLNPAQPSPSLSTPIEPVGADSRHDPAIVRAKIFKALKTDDWDAFVTHALGGTTDINIATERYEDDQNCFHVAIQSGSYKIAINLVNMDSAWVPYLLNSEDAWCSTPLMVAAEGKTDHPELIDALIHAGARHRAQDAAQLAAEHGHVNMTARFLSAQEVLGITASQILVLALHRNPGEGGMKAARLLISLGADLTEALPQTAAPFSNETANRLVLLGAQASRKIAALARLHNVIEVQKYISLGPDTAKALRLLTATTNHAINVTAMSILVNAESRATKKSVSEIYSAVLQTLIRNGKPLEVAVFTAALCAIDRDMLQEIVNPLLAAENPDLIAALIYSGMINLENALKELTSRGNIAATRALLNTAVGNDISALLGSLFEQAIAGNEKSNFALQILILAGADVSTLPDDAQAQIGLDDKKHGITKLSPKGKHQSLILMATNNHVAMIPRLIEGGADKLAALRELADTENWPGIRNLLKADPNGVETLVECLEASDIDLARAVLKAKDISTAALYHIIKAGQIELVPRMIPALTDGLDLLSQAVQDGNEGLGRILIALGADGAPLLASLVHAGQREIASRLTAWGVDVHTAYAHLAAMNGDNGDAGQADLTLMGARPQLALLRAMALNHAAAIQVLATPSIGSKAMEHVAEDPTLTDDARMARLTSLLRLKADADAALIALANLGKIKEIRQLIMRGAPATGLLMDLAKQGNTKAIAAFIIAGADFGAALNTLRASNEHEASRVMTVALVMAQSNSTLQHARANHLPYKIAPSGRVELQ